MKKIFCVLLLICAGAGMVFAQEEAKTEEDAAPGIRKNAVSLDAIPLFKGFVASDFDSSSFFFCMAFAYERLLVPHFTVGAELDLYPGKVDNESYMYFGMAANGRFYPMSEYMEKLFLGAQLGFNVQSVDGKTNSKYGGFAGLTVGLEAGYKLLFGKMLFVEPSMSYTYSKSGVSFFGSTPHNVGWQAGLRIGVLL